MGMKAKFIDVYKRQGPNRPPLDMTVHPRPCAGLTIPSGWVIPPTLHGLNLSLIHISMARYARLAMREFEWYQNLSDEACAMPGTFAVFALGLEGERWAPLVTEYLDLCDDEHSSLQGKFLHALIRKFGFQPWTLGVLVRGALSMQWLEPAREFRSLIANGESLEALLAVKRRFSAYLLPEEDKDPKFRAIAWQSLLWAIWGKDSENGGSKTIKTAPKELKEKYQQVFA